MNHLWQHSKATNTSLFRLIDTPTSQPMIPLTEWLCKQLCDGTRPFNTRCMHSAVPHQPPGPGTCRIPDTGHSTPWPWGTQGARHVPADEAGGASLPVQRTPQNPTHTDFSSIPSTQYITKNVQSASENHFEGSSKRCSLFSVKHLMRSVVLTKSALLSKHYLKRALKFFCTPALHF